MLPIRTNVRPRQTPYANYALIAINVVAFLLTYYPHKSVVFPYMEVPVRDWAQSLQLYPAVWRYWQFLTYAFLHGGFMHIIGNMFFLYIFGNNVNDKLGNTRYTMFYLLAAISSGIGHTALAGDSAVQAIRVGAMTEIPIPIPTLGASGAVAAVTGAFLVLYPKTLITVLYFFFLIGTIELPALWFIALKMIVLDNIIGADSSAVAYTAHLAGYAFGIGVMLVCLAMGWLERSQFDLWALIERWNRRREYRDSVKQQGDPFVGGPQRKHARAKVVPQAPEQAEKEAAIQRLRKEISARLLQRNVSTAAEAYLELMKIDSAQVLARQPLLDIANNLASSSKSAESADAYENFLAHYGSYEHVEQVRLMLGVLYARYLDRPAEAIKHLRQALDRLRDPGQLQMCRTELDRLGG